MEKEEKNPPKNNKLVAMKESSSESESDEEMKIGGGSFPLPQKLEEYFEITTNEKGWIYPRTKAMNAIICRRCEGEELVEYSVIDPHDPDIKVVLRKLFETGFDSIEEDRAIGALLGMVVGDALGAPLEFKSVRYGQKLIEGMSSRRDNRFGLKPGQWTDDASMGICIADSLLVNAGYNPADLKHRFILWWHFGYNNAFRFDHTRYSRHSVGLGGNISQSFAEFFQNGAPYTSSGDKDTSGNGSIMRMAAVPVYFHNDPKQAQEISRLQSLTTHQGEEAAECCRLMAHLIVESIHKGDGTKKILQNIQFDSPLKSIQCLVQAKMEDKTEGKDWDLKDRNWNWKDPEHRYSPTRAQKQPGYIGSYCMDALSMALHCIWSTDNFADALLKAANMCGDADSVAAVTGQIAGAIYGVSGIPKEWIKTVNVWERGEIALKAYKLFHHKPL